MIRFSILIISIFFVFTFINVGSCYEGSLSENSNNESTISQYSNNDDLESNDSQEEEEEIDLLFKDIDQESFQQAGVGGGDTIDKRGGWKFNASVNMGIIYDSNFNKSPNNEESEISKRIGPEIEVSRSQRPFQLKLSYRPSMVYYMNNTSSNNLDQSLAAAYIYKKSKITLSGTESLSYSTQTRTSEESVGSEVFSNNLTNEVAFRAFSKVSFALTFSNGYYEYLDSSQSSRSYLSYSIGPRVYYHVLPKLDLYMGYAKSYIDYFKGGDLNSSSDEFNVGIRGRLSEKVDASLQAGITSREYEDSTQEGVDAVSLSGSVGIILTDKLNLLLNASRSVDESTTDSGYFESTQLGYALVYKYSPKTTFNHTLTWQLNEYPEETTLTDPDTLLSVTDKREDEIMNIGLAVKYEATHNIVLSGGVYNEQRDSVFRNFDYTNNRIQGALSYVF